MKDEEENNEVRHSEYKVRDLVLILLPVLNESKYLDQLINSITTQKHENWILAFQDNFSDDDSFAILERFSQRDKRVVGISSRKRLSGAENWNTLAKWALADIKSDYVCWVSGDDWWSDECYLSNLIMGLKKSHYLTVVTPSFCGIDEPGEIYRTPINLEVQGSFRFNKLLRDWDFVHVILGLYHRAHFERIISSRMAQFTDTSVLDWWWTFSTLRTLEVHSVQTAQYYKRVHLRGENSKLTGELGGKINRFKVALVQPLKEYQILFIRERFRYSLFRDLDVSYARAYFLVRLPVRMSQICGRIFRRKVDRLLSLRTEERIQ